MFNEIHSLKNRDFYLKKLIAFQDTEPVKVITGIRRCGKSSLMKLMICHLRESGISDEQIIAMNFESMEYRSMDVKSFYNYVCEKKSHHNKRSLREKGDFTLFKKMSITVECGAHLHF